MVRRAIADVAGWEVSDLELQRNGPSFTFDTLTSIHREGWAALQIFFITGTDAFAEIATWHRYPAVLDLSHFVVIARPGFRTEDLRQRLPELAPRMTRPDEIRAASTPRIVVVNANTPDVSSTAIRARAVRGEPLEDCVPSAVSAYIAEHRLYRATAPADSPGR